MTYILANGKEITSEVLLKLEPEELKHLPMSCKVCPAAMWQLYGKVDALKVRCFCRVKHVYEWPAPPDQETQDCDLIYQAEQKDEQQKEEKAQKRADKEAREERRERENAAMEQRHKDRIARREKTDAQKATEKAEREEKARIRKLEKAQEQKEKDERQRLREERRIQRENAPAKGRKKATTPENLIPETPDSGNHSDIPAFQEWAITTPPFVSGEDTEQED